MRIATFLIACAVASPLSADSIEGIVTPAEKFVLTVAVPGIVEKVNVKQGDRVQKGDLLAMMDATEQKLHLEEAMTMYRLGEAKYRKLRIASDEERAVVIAKLAAGEAELSFAEKTYQRAKALHDSKAIPENEVLEAEQELAAAKNAVAQLKARLVAIKSPGKEELAIAEAELHLAKIAVEAAELRVKQCVLTSPIQGTVLECSFEAGGLAQPGASLITMADLEKLTVKASITESRLRALKKGLKCRVQTSAGELEGSVSAIAPIVIDGQVGFSVQLKRPQVNLLPGMKATVSLSMPDTD